MSDGYRRAGLHTLGKPRLHFVLDPSDGMRRDFHAHGKRASRLQLVNLRLAKSCHVDDLRKP